MFIYKNNNIILKMCVTSSNSLCGIKLYENKIKKKNKKELNSRPKAKKMRQRIINHLPWQHMLLEVWQIVGIKNIFNSYKIKNKSRGAATPSRSLEDPPLGSRASQLNLSWWICDKNFRYNEHFWINFSY
jgi:hypothetical protein